MDVYPISEDTLLILKNIRCGDEMLDMGTGNGEIAIECAKRGSKVTAVDIDPEAIDYARKRARKEGVRIKFVLSNLFENVQGKYDTIVFNPPYLPGEAKSIKDLQWAGGEYGDDITIKFLKEAWRYLKTYGEIYIILSSFNRLNEILKMPYRFALLDKIKLSFHEIYLYRAEKLKNGEL